MRRVWHWLVDARPRGRHAYGQEDGVYRRQAEPPLSKHRRPPRWSGRLVLAPTEWTPA